MALSLYERMPGSIQFKSLASNARGEFSIEGLSASSATALADFRDTLSHHVELDSLSQKAHEAIMGGKGGSTFTLRGHFAELDLRGLQPLSRSDASDLFGTIQLWAKESGLGDLTFKDPIRKSVSDVFEQHRQKVWGRGSFRQISAFVESVGQLEQRAALGELVMIPVYEQADFWRYARLYAAVDVLVQDTP